MITKLLIKFCDNDFYNTFYTTLETILHAYEYSGKLPFSKEQICLIINELAYGHYLLFQNQFEYVDGVNIKNYLRIDESLIYINEEVDELLKDITNANSEWYVLYVEESCIMGI